MMQTHCGSRSGRAWRAVAGLMLGAVLLAGCVPVGGAYYGGYNGGYYPAPEVYAPPVVLEPDIGPVYGWGGGPWRGDRGWRGGPWRGGAGWRGGGPGWHGDRPGGWGGGGRPGFAGGRPGFPGRGLGGMHGGGMRGGGGGCHTIGRC